MNADEEKSKAKSKATERQFDVLVLRISGWHRGSNRPLRANKTRDGSAPQNLLGFLDSQIKAESFTGEDVMSLYSERRKLLSDG